ncbi:MAG: hypothetical protein M3033_04310 [Acidobacteriota bacterium]|nr:hypothetical protein [Acidobacteriota bacterium]
MKSALKGSLLMEEQTVKDRFEKAETLLGEKSVADVSKKGNEKRREEQIKVVRDSFTMPQTDYELITLLKKRALQAGSETNKSEVLRAGLLALNQMSDTEFLDKISIVEKIKTGRPKQ